jgi:hypothetical protein
MQHTLTSSPATSTDAEGAPAFNVVIAYEDFETGKHAKKTYDFLVEHLGRDCLFTNQMWKFDILGLPKLREIAVKDAAAADIIIISCRGDELPAALKLWIESWLAGPRSTLALVALFGRPWEEPTQNRAVRAYLADVAARAKVELFAQPGDSSAAQRCEEPFAFARHLGMGSRTLSTLAGAVRRDIPYPRWGINE